MEKLFMDTLECSYVVRSSLAEEFYEDMLETINAVADTSSPAKLQMVDAFLEKLLVVVASDSFPFVTRMEVTGINLENSRVGMITKQLIEPLQRSLKALNLLLEYCPPAKREELKKLEEHQSLMEKLGMLICKIGDYEFQVSLTECLFRLTHKGDREQYARIWFADHHFFQAFLNVRESRFETDCRIFLNVVNGDESKPISVFSIPAVSVWLGNFQLQKPVDKSYTDFWIDFNTGSKRASMFCNQSISCDQETDDENPWETVSVWDSNVVGYSVHEFGDMKKVLIQLTKAADDLVTFGPKVKEKMISVEFDCKFDVETALIQTFGKGKLQAAGKKASEAACPIQVNPESGGIAYSGTNSTLNEATQQAATCASGYTEKMCNENQSTMATTPSSVAQLNGGAIVTPRLKVSVPCEPMRTPTRVSLSSQAEGNQAGAQQLKKTVNSVKTAGNKMEEANPTKKKSPHHVQASVSPKTPKGKYDKRAKTPLVMVVTDPCERVRQKEKMGTSDSKQVGKVQDGGTRQMEISPTVNKKARHNSGKTQQQNRGQLENACEKSQEMTVIPESQPVLSHGKERENKGNIDNTEDVFQENGNNGKNSSTTARGLKTKQMADLKARLSKKDPDFKICPSNTYKVSDSPGLSTVTEESCTPSRNAASGSAKMTPKVPNMEVINEAEQCSRHNSDEGPEFSHDKSECRQQLRSGKTAKQNFIEVEGNIEHVAGRKECQKKSQRVTRGKKNIDTESDKEKIKHKFQKKIITSQKTTGGSISASEKVFPKRSLTTAKSKEFSIDKCDMESGSLSSQDCLISQSLYYRYSQTQSQTQENSQVGQSASQREPKIFKSRVANSVQKLKQDTSLYDFEPEEDGNFQATNDDKGLMTRPRSQNKGRRDRKCPNKKEKTQNVKTTKQSKTRKQNARKVEHNSGGNGTENCKLQKLNKLAKDEDQYVSDFIDEDEKNNEKELCASKEYQSTLCGNTFRNIVEIIQNASGTTTQSVQDVNHEKSVSGAQINPLATRGTNREKNHVAQQNLSSRSERKALSKTSSHSQIFNRSEMEEQKTRTYHHKTVTHGIEKKKEVTPPIKTKKRPKGRRVHVAGNGDLKDKEACNTSVHTQVQSISNRITLSDEENDADLSTDFGSSSVAAFTQMCKGLVAQSGGQRNKQTRQRKLVNYKDLSDSELSEDMEDSHVEAEVDLMYKKSEPVTEQKPEEITFYAESKSGNKMNKHQKLKKRSVFSETDCDESRSEVSWLGSSARKQKAKTRTYTAKDKKLPVKPSMIIDEQTETSNVKVLKTKGAKLKDKTDRDKWKQESPSGRNENSDAENLNYEPARKKRNLVKEKDGSKLHCLPTDNALLNEVLSKLTVSVELEKLSQEEINSKTCTQTGITECSALSSGSVCKVMKTKHKRQFNADYSIEEMRFEDDNQAPVIMDSPIMPTLVMSGSKSLPADDEDQLEIATQSSSITHISSVKTPRTPAQDMGQMEEVDKFLQPTLEENDIGWKSEDSDGEESVCSPDIEPEYTPFQAKKATAELCLKPRKLFSKEPDDELDSDYEGVDTKEISADVGISGVSSVLQSFNSEIKQSLTRRQCVEKFTKDTIDATNKQISSIWDQQCNKRHKLMDKFQMSVLQEVTALEGDIDKLKQSEERAMDFFQKEQKVIRTCLHSQGQRLKKLKQVQMGFSDEVHALEKSQHDQQGSVQELLRKEMRAMQKNIMNQAQQQEILNVKKALMQTLFL